MSIERGIVMKHKKLLIVVVVVALILVAAAIGNYWDGKKPAPAPSPTPQATEPAQSTVPAPTPDTDAKADILSSVESLIPEEYRGASYSCDILTASDGSGYIVSLQIDVDVVPPESSEVIASLEAAINGLEDTRISSVEIIAVKDMQIVDTNSST